MVALRAARNRSLGPVRGRHWRRLGLAPRLGLLAALPWALIAAATAADERLEFFEAKVRPLLAARCYACHSAERTKTEAGLALDSRVGWQSGGDSGPPIVPGKPDESLLIQAVRYTAGGPQMPPAEAGGKLSAGEIEILVQWIRQGATDPREGRSTTRAMTADEARSWWAFVPLRPVEPPPADETSARGPIDRFLQAGTDKAGLRPLGPADRRVLLRRATFDLVGLPPTPEEMADFLADTSSDAFAKVVERLLASPHYGERWARHWLDLVRYADYFQANPREHGMSSSFELFEAWRYRDWVVQALNRDLPYDQFVVHQIAGDRLTDPAGRQPYADGLIATTVLAIGAWDNADADKQHIVSDIVDDQINLVGQTFLGLTLSCARCHDHKFDPITSEDYYGLAGIFYSTHVLSSLGPAGGHTVLVRVPLAPADYLERRREQLAAIAAVDAQLAKLLPPKPASEAAGQSNNAEPPAPPAEPSAESAADIARLQQERNKLAAELLPEPDLAIAAQEEGTPGGLFPGIQDVPIHVRGNWTKLGKVVPRRFPLALAGDQQPAIGQGSGRLELARWIASPDNPLTARVIVNRVWQWHFGAGLVRTSSNFGKLGDHPSHAELLDWLTADFIRSGWSLKALHRQIMSSAAYQRASAAGAPDAEQVKLLQADPDNRLLARFTPQRIEAECLRDALLAIGGQLDRTLGGPAVLELDAPRRSLYIRTTRWTRPYFATLFDGADPEQLVDRRSVSTAAPQALFFLNHPFVAASARRIAERLLAAEADDSRRIQRAYELCYGRPAEDDEVQTAILFLQQAAARGPAESWTDLVRTILASNEFVYVD